MDEIDIKKEKEIIETSNLMYEKTKENARRDMKRILNEDGTEEERIERIVAAANEHGGRDNMGIILVDPQL